LKNCHLAYYSIEEVRRRLNNTKEVKFSRSNFNQLIHNPIYTGKIYIPSFKEAIIDEQQFWEVQQILDGRTPKNTKKLKGKDELPLRGYLQCARCGNVLTGSASRRKLGTRYFYCYCREGCSERLKA
jgi:site-specific DNA recombinase